MRELGWRIGAVVTRNQSSARRAVGFIGAGTALVGLSRRVLASTYVPGRARTARRGRGDRQRTRSDRRPGSAGASYCAPPSRRNGFQRALRRALLRRLGRLRDPLQTFDGVTVPPLEGKVCAIEGDPASGRAHRRKNRQGSRHSSFRRSMRATSRCITRQARSPRVTLWSWWKQLFGCSCPWA